MPTYITVPAERIDAFLSERKFVRVDTGNTERIYSRSGKNKPCLKLTVYSSVPANGKVARECGEDAIRVVLMGEWKRRDGSIAKWALHRCKRIHRTGSVDAVLARVKERLLEAAGAAEEYGCGPCPKCGAPVWADSGRCIDKKCREAAGAEAGTAGANGVEANRGQAK